MKITYLSVLAVAALLGVSAAQANDAVNASAHNNVKVRHHHHHYHQKMDMNQNGERPVGYEATANRPEAQKWTYSGNNAYHSIAGQVAYRDSMEDGDNRAFVVRPVRGPSQFNANLRQGDTGQSDATRVNQTFNN